jgi:trehalose 6-phosphate phosphatase
VLDPDAAAVPAATRSLLEAAVERYALVACISGRRALDARRIVGLGSISYIGNHGLERLAPGEVAAVTDPAVAPLARAVREFARSAHDAELVRLGVRLEDKDAIWAFHWRGAVDEDAARDAVGRVAAAAEEEGLVPHWGRKVLEVRPPLATDKGTAVAAALEGSAVARALYAGDDRTDLDAFHKLRALAAEGRIDATCVGVRSAEGPDEIVAEADVVVDGPDGVRELLERLT